MKDFFKRNTSCKESDTITCSMKEWIRNEWIKNNVKEIGGEIKKTCSPNEYSFKIVRDIKYWKKEKSYKKKIMYCYNKEIKKHRLVNVVTKMKE